MCQKDTPTKPPRHNSAHVRRHPGRQKFWILYWGVIAHVSACDCPHDGSRSPQASSTMRRALTHQFLVVRRPSCATRSLMRATSMILTGLYHAKVSRPAKSGGQRNRRPRCDRYATTAKGNKPPWVITCCQPEIRITHGSSWAWCRSP